MYLRGQGLRCETRVSGMHLTCMRERQRERQSQKVRDRERQQGVGRQALAGQGQRPGGPALGRAATTPVCPVAPEWPSPQPPGAPLRPCAQAGGVASIYLTKLKNQVRIDSVLKIFT